MISGRVLPLLLLVAAAPLETAPDPATYTCRVPVTGNDGHNRPAAFAACVRQVLVKLSADPALDDPSIALPPTRALRDFAYLDLMTDLPLHDEQGTRDRPFEFLGHVDPGAAAAALRTLGLAPWLAPRPTVAVRVTVTDMKGNRFALTGDGLRGERQRRALLDAAERFALPVALPAEDDPAPPAGPVLAGTLRWDEAGSGWAAEWRMDGDTWVVTGVSFDAAFRAGVTGAANRLAHAPAGATMGKVP